MAGEGAGFSAGGGEQTESDIAAYQPKHSAPREVGSHPARRLSPEHRSLHLQLFSTELRLFGPPLSQLPSSSFHPSVQLRPRVCFSNLGRRPLSPRPSDPAALLTNTNLSRMGFLHETRVFFWGEPKKTAAERRLIIKIDCFVRPSPLLRPVSLLLDTPVLA